MKIDGLHIKDAFNKELPADPIEQGTERKVTGACFSFIDPTVPANPSLIHTSKEVAKLIGLDPKSVESDAFLRVFSGAEILDGTRPFAMCYGGHQFGNWAGQLGDGRAINLTEIEHENKTWALQLKGAGKTPYSRNADGLAVLRSSIREHLCSEAMHHLGVPTSRSLSLMLTGNKVMRDVMYDGNPEMEQGAIVCRVAESFIRFGSFEILLSNQDVDTLKELADFTLKHHFPELPATPEGYGAMFKEVCRRSLDMVIHWQRVGFVHGVMNTDNMSILGHTIDYGPYGWLEGYDLTWTPNTTDSQHRRYRYGKQPEMVFWNLHKLANALFPLVNDAKPFEEALEEYGNDYLVKYKAMKLAKLGITGEEDGDSELIVELEKVLQGSETDMTLFYRGLAHYEVGQKLDEDNAFFNTILEAFYEPSEFTGTLLLKWRNWFELYDARLTKEKSSDQERKAKMNKVNPKYVLRNYMAQLAIDEAEKGDYSVVEELDELLKLPYDEQENQAKWYAKRPEWARDKVGCSMLSCSS
jgi:serine/tyrosine/threonine adenylyltransferase